MGRTPTETPAKSTLRRRKHEALRKNGFEVLEVTVHEDWRSILVDLGDLIEVSHLSLKAGRKAAGDALSAYLERKRRADITGEIISERVRNYLRGSV
jgi:hypothetical protein